MISEEIQQQILKVLQTVKAEGDIGLTTSQIAQQLGTYRGRITANASILEERKLVKKKKIANALFWFIADD